MQRDEGSYAAAPLICVPRMRTLKEQLLPPAMCRRRDMRGRAGGSRPPVDHRMPAVSRRCSLSAVMGRAIRRSGRRKPELKLEGAESAPIVEHRSSMFRGTSSDVSISS